MGAFSWLRAERTTQRKNIAVGDIYKILIPQEFGGGFIRDEELDWLGALITNFRQPFK